MCYWHLRSRQVHPSQPGFIIIFRGTYTVHDYTCSMQLPGSKSWNWFRRNFFHKGRRWFLARWADWVSWFTADTTELSEILRRSQVNSTHKHSQLHTRNRRREIETLPSDSPVWSAVVHQVWAVGITQPRHACTHTHTPLPVSCTCHGVAPSRAHQPTCRVYQTPCHSQYWKTAVD